MFLQGLAAIDPNLVEFEEAIDRLRITLPCLV